MKRNLFTIMLAFLVVFGMNAQKAEFMSVKKYTDKEKKELNLPSAKIKAPIYSPSNSKAAILQEGFETWPLTGWTILNEDGGTKTWDEDDAQAHSGTKSASVSYETPNNDWLISPQFTVQDGAILKFYAMSRSGSFPEDFNVKVSTAGNTVADFTITLESVVGVPTTWTEYSYVLTDDAGINDGDQLYVAIQCVSNDEWTLYVDDFSVATLPAHDMGVISVTPSVVSSGTTVTPQVTIKNFGDNDEGTWDVVLSDGGLYSSTVSSTATVTSLNNLVVDMDAWTPADGNYTLTATVTVAGDANASNNEVAVNCVVVPTNNSYAWNASGSGALKGPSTLQLPTGVLSSIVEDAGSFVTGADMIDGVWYGIQYQDPAPYKFVTIDRVSGALTVISDITEHQGIAHDYNSGNTYVISFAGELGTIDLATGNVTAIGGSTANVIGLACGNDGTLYAISLDDNLYTIDAATGAGTLVGPLGIDINYAQDIAFDRENNKLYGTLYSDHGGLYEINMATGSVGTQLGANIPELTGFAIPKIGTENDILSYSFVEQTGAATIDAVAHTVAIEVFNSTNPDGLVATFSLSPMASAKVGAIDQVSGTTPNTFVFGTPLAYTVTAENGTTQEWNVTVTEAPIGTDATLSDLTVDAITVTGFDPATYTYNVVLPFGTTTVPTVDGVTNDPNATYAVVDATDLSGDVAARTTTLTVTAQDGIATQDYTVVFSVSNDILMQDGTFTACGANFFDTGGATGDFQNSEDYTLTINPENAGDMVEVTFTVYDMGGSTYDYLKIYDGSDATGTLLIDGSVAGSDFITSPFKSTTGSLTFVFHSSSVVTNPGWEATLSCFTPISVNDIASKGISVYPNPSNGTFTVNVESDFNLEVLDITGKVINTKVLNGNSTISIENAGVYFLRFTNEEGSVTQKVIVQ